MARRVRNFQSNIMHIPDFPENVIRCLRDVCSKFLPKLFPDAGTIYGEPHYLSRLRVACARRPESPVCRPLRKSVLPWFRYAQPPSCDQPLTFQGGIQLRVALGETKFRLRYEISGERSPLGEKSESFEYRAVAETVRVIDEFSRVSVLAPQVSVEALGRVHDVAAQGRVVEHVYYRAVGVGNEHVASRPPEFSRTKNHLFPHVFQREDGVVPLDSLFPRRAHGADDMSLNVWSVMPQCSAAVRPPT